MPTRLWLFIIRPLMNGDVVTGKNEAFFAGFRNEHFWKSCEGNSMTANRFGIV